MRIVFLGTPEFAVASLRALAEAGYEIACVVTAPDRPAGRGQKIQHSAVKEYALSKGMKLLQPVNLKDPAFLESLRDIRADLQIVVAFRMLPEAVWNMPRLGTYNLHASLLPRYRGAAPINRAIMNGETMTGVTTFRLQHAIDSGSILLQESQEITTEMTAGELHDVLMHKGAALLVRSVGLIADHDSRGMQPPFTRQDEAQVTHAPKLFREDCKLDWSRSAWQLHNQVRGLSPFPGAFTTLATADGTERNLKIFRTSLSDVNVQGPNGMLVAASGGQLLVRCGTGSLELRELQLEGKKRMPAGEFLKGVRIDQAVLK